MDNDLAKLNSENRTICKICDRELDDSADKHHLIPKTFKGIEYVWLHKICHRKLHSVFTEREMLNYYHTINRILENEDIQKFVKWVKNKPIDFYITTKDLNSRKRKRRR